MTSQTQGAPSAKARPLSPHLGIYKPMLTMLMSIAHRITGAGLYLGTILVTWWLLALSTDVAAFSTYMAVQNSWIGQLILLGFTWALCHHLMGGVRHFIWDLGYGMDHPEREYLAIGTLAGGLILTALIWLIAWLVK